MAGKLYLCATPIGNLEDITCRVLRTLKEVDLIAAEDTRNSIKLLNHFEIKTPMTSYHEYNKIEKAYQLVDKLREGKNIALITDAGTPGISDPGEDLVRICYEEGIEVTSLPGAAACITALTMSGLPTRRFAFEAFLPRDKKERAAILQELKDETRTIIIYEAPHHLVKTLEELYDTLGDRQISICRELTKRYEEKMRTTLSDSLVYYGENEPRGEYVLVIHGKTFEELAEEARKSWEDMSLEEHMQVYESQGTPRKEARKNTGGLDFEDILKECEEFLQRDPGQRTYWQNRFEYILIDEFQDINYRQYSIVKILAEKHRNIFAVGDDDQAIYGFRGARPACMRQFVEEFGAKQILLRTNYRSHPDIVEASLAVIDENKDRFHKDLEPCEAHRRQAGGHKTDAGYRKEYRVKIREFSEASEQMRYLVQSLKNRINGETCAVLFRTNLAMQGVAARLTGEGIPFSMKEKGRNIYDHFIAQDLLSYLRIAQGCATRADYLRVSNRPYRNISREAFGAEASLPALKKYYEDLTAGSPDAGQQKAQKAVGVWIRQMEFVKNTELKLAMAFLRKACGYERYLRVRAAQEGKTDLTEWQEVLDFITEDAGRYRSLEEWQEAQELYREQLQCRENVRSGMQKKQEKQENSGITLLTVHAAKGLEFDHVWIPDCNEKTFPHGSSREPEHCEEERRIFYVAMTRAKKDLELLCLTGTRERPRFPSRFLIPLNRYHR